MRERVFVTPSARRPEWLQALAEAGCEVLTEWTPPWPPAEDDPWLTLAAPGEPVEAGRLGTLRFQEREERWKGVRLRWAAWEWTPVCGPLVVVASSGVFARGNGAEDLREALEGLQTLADLVT